MVQFGLNDSNFWETDLGEPRVALRAFRENLNEILEKILRVSPKQIFINTNHPSRKASYTHQPNISHEASSSKYNEAIREVAGKLSRIHGLITLIDIERDCFLSKGGSHPQFLLDDGVHLSESGHRAYSEHVVPIVRDKLRILRE